MRDWIRLLQSCGLPQDALCDCARVTMTGRTGVLVEGQRGVIELSSERIRLLTGDGVLEVSGQALRLCTLSSAQAVVAGKVIDAVSYRGLPGREREGTQLDG